MTTKVTISIAGNKACCVSVPGQPDSTVQPGTGIEVQIHGDMHVSVREVGEFLNGPTANGGPDGGGGGPPEENEPGP